jgi:hypothetical protein
MNVLNFKKEDNKNLIRMHVQSLTSRMDTFIYTGRGLQRLPQIVNVWIDAPLSRKMMKGISSQVCRLSERYSQMDTLHVFGIQFVRAYISKEVTDLC